MREELKEKLRDVIEWGNGHQPMSMKEWRAVRLAESALHDFDAPWVYVKRVGEE